MGAKDLLAVKGYPTTWGAGGFEKQSFDEDATVVKRLNAAGAVLIAKTTLVRSRWAIMVRRTHPQSLEHETRFKRINPPDRPQQPQQDA